MIDVNEQEFLIISGIALTIFGLILVLNYRRFLSKWLKNFNLEQPDADPMTINLVTARQKYGSIFVLIVGLFLLSKGLGIL